MWSPLMAQMVKHLPTMQETWLSSVGHEDRLEKRTVPTPVFLPGEFHGQRRLTGYSPWSRKEQDTTEQLNNEKNDNMCIYKALCNFFLCGPFLKSLLSLLQYCFCFFFFFFIGFLAKRYVRSQLPDQEVNMHPLHWNVKS